MRHFVDIEKDIACDLQRLRERLSATISDDNTFYAVGKITNLNPTILKDVCSGKSKMISMGAYKKITEYVEWHEAEQVQP